MEGNGHLIDLRLINKGNAKINEKGKFKIINGNSIVVVDRYDLALAKMSLFNTEKH